MSPVEVFANSRGKLPRMLNPQLDNLETLYHAVTRRISAGVHVL